MSPSLYNMIWVIKGAEVEAKASMECNEFGSEFSVPSRLQ
jgi:hypothetical protein